MSYLKSEHVTSPRNISPSPTVLVTRGVVNRDLVDLSHWQDRHLQRLEHNETVDSPSLSKDKSKKD